eukprot:scaffold33165_cov68-Phaeocystis_antarctica.AAC.3
MTRVGVDTEVRRYSGSFVGGGRGLRPPPGPRQRPVAPASARLARERGSREGVCSHVIRLPVEPLPQCCSEGVQAARSEISRCCGGRAICPLGIASAHPRRLHHTRAIVLRPRKGVRRYNPRPRLTPRRVVLVPQRDFGLQLARDNRVALITAAVRRSCRGGRRHGGGLPARAHRPDSVGAGRAHRSEPSQHVLVRWRGAQEGSEARGVGVREEAEQLVAQDERALARQRAQALDDVPPPHARSGELLDEGVIPPPLVIPKAP